ncbi:MAG: arsenate reductase ArsC [Balneolaceae bacterium]|nr:arsenate reductase ArsC [Balneolaceae bacterium]
MTNILILCTGNSCRSQMAHGLMVHLDTDNTLTVYSAGIETHGVNPRAVQVMKEAGFDISHHTSNHIDEYRDIDFNYVITVCDHAKENCPYFPTRATRIHHNFSDPAQATGTEEEILSEFRRVRDEIKEFVKVFLKKQVS